MKSKLSLLFAVSLIFIAAACAKPAPENTATTESATSATASEETVANTTAPESTFKAEDHGSYVIYSADNLQKAKDNGNKVVLFFYASWCPFCVPADAAFKANMKNIPPGVTVLRVDYDNSDALKTKYGVTYQHTFVQIDYDDNLITKWNSGDVELLRQNVK